MKIRLTQFVLASVIAAGPLAAQAADLSYNYGQVFYKNVDIDTAGGGSVDGDGLGLGGSLELTDVLFLDASYSYVDYERGMEQSGWSVGAGVHLPAAPTADLVISAAVGNDELKTRFGRDDTDFLAAGIALRGRVAPALELEGGLDYIDYDRGGDDTVWSIGGFYDVAPKAAVGVRFSNGDNADVLSIGGRFYF